MSVIYCEIYLYMNEGASEQQYFFVYIGIAQKALQHCVQSEIHCDMIFYLVFSCDYAMVNIFIPSGFRCRYSNIQQCEYLDVHNTYEYCES